MKLLAALLAFAGVVPMAPQLPHVPEAKRFLDSLDDSKRSRAVYRFESDKRFDFHFVPRNVPGIVWAEMTERQREAGVALLKRALGEVGYSKAESIRKLEPILREMENGNPGRDESRYGFVFFGEPAEKGRWAWRYEGHHLSLTFAYQDGKLMASTPQFLGSNPAEVRVGQRKGFRAMPKEQDLAFELLGKLSSDQLKMALVSERAPADIMTLNERRASMLDKKGLNYKDMSAQQQKLLLDLLRAHTEVQSEGERERRLRTIQAEERDQLVFTWLGSATPGSGHYYRIQGENLLVEYDNTQNGANHIHTVWRNRKEDFGGDPLKEHYRHGH